MCVCTGEGRALSRVLINYIDSNSLPGNYSTNLVKKGEQLECKRMQLCHNRISSGIVACCINLSFFFYPMPVYISTLICLDDY